MALTDTAIKGLKAGSKILKKTDADGLFIEVRTSGDKFFRFRYRNALGKEQTLSLGKYPDLSLAQARKLCQTSITLSDSATIILSGQC